MTGKEAPLSEKDLEYRAYFDAGGAQKYKDAPVSVQIVGRRLQEEKLLAMAEVVDNVLREERERQCEETITIHIMNRPRGETAVVQASGGQRAA